MPVDTPPGGLRTLRGRLAFFFAIPCGNYRLNDVET
jgi:hypothetical protein